ncbi:50S ribosomal protein L29 [Candidatus Woesearchaeota archaeon]|nr:50S ribosomal protein L29 [Candidatus Woesearchaeota archaeon]
MKNKELQAMPDGELKTKLTELRKELLKSNAQIAMKAAPKSPGQVKQVKKTIARILTTIRRNEKKA